MRDLSCMEVSDSPTEQDHARLKEIYLRSCEGPTGSSAQAEFVPFAGHIGESVGEGTRSKGTI